MNLFLQKIISFFLAFVVLFSTTSFTIEKHICGDDVCSVSLEEASFESNPQKSFPYLHEEESCCLEETSCCIDDDNCCKNEYIIVKGATIKKEKELKVKIKSDMPLFYVPVPEEFTVYTKIDNKNLTKYYTQPFITKDILALYQIYII